MTTAPGADERRIRHALHTRGVGYAPQPPAAARPRDWLDDVIDDREPHAATPLRGDPHHHHRRRRAVCARRGPRQRHRRLRLRLVQRGLGVSKKTLGGWTVAPIARGLRILGERWFDGPRRWIAAGENALDKAIRVAMVGGVGYVLWRIVSHSWAVLCTAVALLLLLALRAGVKAASDAPEHPVKASQNAPDGPAEDWDESYFIPIIWDILDGPPRSTSPLSLADSPSTLAGRGIRTGSAPTARPSTSRSAPR
jgi:hypothetical protein